MSEYEYRPLHRWRNLEAGTEWGPWQPILTHRGGGRAYQTIGSAKGVLSREKRANTRRSAYRQGRFEYEYKVQRRPLGEWEDVN